MKETLAELMDGMTPEKLKQLHLLLKLLDKKTLARVVEDKFYEIAE